MWRHAWPVKTLYPQFIEQGGDHLGGVFGVISMFEYCSAAQFPKGGDHALCQYVTLHAGIHGSLNELYLPSALMQPHTMALPPPCLTVGTHLSLFSPPGSRHTPSETK